MGYITVQAVTEEDMELGISEKWALTKDFVSVVYP